jgi:hypothetical protein
VTHLEEGLLRLQADLNALGLRWALVGGVAVSIRAEPRTTRDLDVAVSVSGDQEAEKISFLLKLRGYTPEPVQHFVETADGRLSMARLRLPGAEEAVVGVDLLFAFAGIEDEIVAGADMLELLPGVRVPVASVGHLIALKLLAGRDKDWADARELWSRAHAADIQLARHSLGLIESRGFQRGKDLSAAFARLMVPEG